MNFEKQITPEKHIKTPKAESVANDSNKRQILVQKAEKLLDGEKISITVGEKTRLLKLCGLEQYLGNNKLDDIIESHRDVIREFVYVNKELILPKLQYLGDQVHEKEKALSISRQIEKEILFPSTEREKISGYNHLLEVLLAKKINSEFRSLAAPGWEIKVTNGAEDYFGGLDLKLVCHEKDALGKEIRFVVGIDVQFSGSSKSFDVKNEKNLGYHDYRTDCSLVCVFNPIVEFNNDNNSGLSAWHYYAEQALAQVGNRNNQNDNVQMPHSNELMLGLFKVVKREAAKSRTATYSDATEALIQSRLDELIKKIEFGKAI